jgi:hypothetical protein
VEGWGESTSKTPPKMPVFLVSSGRGCKRVRTPVGFIAGTLPPRIRVPGAKNLVSFLLRLRVPDVFSLEVRETLKVSSL